jgi:hypothetical protein
MLLNFNVFEFFLGKSQKKAISTIQTLEGTKKKNKNQSL